MKTVSTKLDKQTYEQFQKICNNDSQCMSERLRELIKTGIKSHENGIEPIESTGDPPRPEVKNVRISYDSKTWYENGKQVV